MLIICKTEDQNEYVIEVTGKEYVRDIARILISRFSCPADQYSFHINSSSISRDFLRELSPESSIQDLRLSEGDSFLLKPKPGAIKRQLLPPIIKEEPKAEPQKPATIVKSDPKDPPNFDQLLKNLLDKGFEPEQSASALRAASYDPVEAFCKLKPKEAPKAPDMDPKVAEQLAKLSPSEREDVLELSKIEPDIGLVLDIYIANEKDKAVTEQMIK